MVRHLTSYVAGSVGQGMPFVVIAVEFTRRGLPDAWLAAVATARVVPYLVCSPVAGAVAGRCGLGRVVAVSAAARVGLTVLVLSFLQESTPSAALALLVLIGVAGTPCYPALMAGLRNTVAEPQRDRWGRLVVLLESVAFSAGPAVGGALVVFDGSGRTALVVSITLFAVATAIALRADPLGPARPGRGARSSLRPALGALVHPAGRSSVAALLVVNVLGGAAMALLPAIARELRPEHNGLLGWLTAVQGIGALLVVAAGSAAASAVGRRLVRMSLFVACGSLLSLSVASRPLLAVAACAVFGGAAVMVEATGSVELLQRLPASAVGAAFGLLDSLMVAAMVVGALVGPLLASIAGPRWSVALLAITAAIWMLQRPRLLLARQAVPSAGTPPELRAAILEGAAR